MNIIKRILHIALRECRRMKANRMYLFCMIVFPVFVTFFFTSLMDEGQPQDMPGGVVDLDNSSTTRKLTRLLDSFQSTKVVAHYPSVDEARHAVQKGDIYGFVYFPKNTTADLLASRQPTISYYYSYASLTAGSLVFKDLKTMATLGSAAVGKQVMTAKGYTDRQIMAFLQPIVLDTHTVGNPWVNYNVYLTTMLVPTCMLLLVFLITAYSLGTELKQQTAKQLMEMSADNPFVAITGKMLPQTIVWLLVMGFYLYYVRTVPVVAHVDEPLLALGRTQLLNGGHGVPHACHGSGAAGARQSFPDEACLPCLRDCRLWRLSVYGRSAKSHSPCALRLGTAAGDAAHRKGIEGIRLYAVEHH